MEHDFFGCFVRNFQESTEYLKSISPVFPYKNGSNETANSRPISSKPSLTEFQVFEAQFIGERNQAERRILHSVLMQLICTLW